MVFSSYLFLFYLLPLSLVLYYAVPRRAKQLVLTVLSYVFYGWANPLFLVLLLGSTMIDFVAALVIDGERARLAATGEHAWPSRKARIALAASLVTNLALLAFFKYFNFGLDSYDALVTWLGLSDLRLDAALRVTLPLGISFYTFEAMSYAIDVYRGDARAIRNFIDYSCYVSMFPQLVAGPIVRFSEIADQLLHLTHTAT